MTAVLILALLAAACLPGDTIDQQVRRVDELLRRGAYAEARVELSQVLANLEAGQPTPLLVTVLNNLAGIQADMENYRDAERLYLRSLSVWDHLDPADRPTRLSIQLNLLGVYLQAGWLRRAERLIEETAGGLPAADLRERIHFLDRVGSLKRAQKRPEEAAGSYREALELAEAAGQDEAAGFVWNSVGVLRAEQRKMTESVDAFERALSAHERAAGSDHPALIATLTNLGAAYLAESRLDKAEPVLTRARSLAERFLGVSHPALYRILMLEARMLDRMNRRAEAKQARRRAQDISRKIGPRDRAAFVVDIEDLRRR